MRIYQNLSDAILEIRRDLYKSPKVPSQRVQNEVTEGGLMAEATNYSYSIMGSGMPSMIDGLVKLAAKHFPFWADHADELNIWLLYERASRLYSSSMDGSPPEFFHPTLSGMVEGNHWGYTYQERLNNWASSIAATLNRNPESRRAFWPIFQPLDAVRSGALTRIPCTLGYQWMIRPDPSGIEGESDWLEVTMISRSVDFDKYWISDIWLAHQLTGYLNVRLNKGYRIGTISHFITSFHRFINPDEETF